MGNDREIDRGENVASFKSFMDQVIAQTLTRDPPFLQALWVHFGVEPKGLPVVVQEFEPADHPNVQLGLDAYLAQEDCSSKLQGVVAKFPRRATLGDLLVQVGQSVATPGPVEYLNIPLEDKALPCVKCGLYLVTDHGKQMAVFVNGPDEAGAHRKVSVEVMATMREEAEGFLASLRQSMEGQNVYRGRVLSVSRDAGGTVQVHFHSLAKIEPDQIILPEGLLERIERQTIRFSTHRETLRAMGCHLRRGVLLYGPPGTGKTLTAMYLAGKMQGRTALLLTGGRLGVLPQSCALANALQPSIMVIEDVDLIAEERTRTDRTGPLFDLLNQMDGLSEDADVLFLLTTNRPDTLEPALASRPGRIDLAIEIPLPDADCRKKLFELYCRNLPHRFSNMKTWVQRTEGASGAFIRELIRKAALLAAEKSRDDLVVEDRHVDTALHELVTLGGELTRNLLGGGRVRVR